MTQAAPTLVETGLEARIVRYADLQPCYNAFIDTRSPGSERKENFTIIGPGVSENPEQHVHIAEPHGFNIGGARQPPGCVNSQHSHETAEVFVVHSGHWRFDFGETGADAHLEAGPGDVVSFPTRVFRGFTNTGDGQGDDEPGFLWAVLGRDDPGRVTWAPSVFEMARDYGLILLDNGALIDTTQGQRLPDGAREMPVTTAEVVASMGRVRPEEAERFVWRTPDALLPGVTLLIGADAPLGPTESFTLDRIVLDPDAPHRFMPSTPTVVFVHLGDVAVSADGARTSLGEGDTMSLAPGTTYDIEGRARSVLFAVHGLA